MRTDIKVPYEEKDRAKALGARWDPQAKTWYVPEGIDTAPFEKWLSHDPYVFVLEGERKCHKCHEVTKVVAIGVPYDSTMDDEDLEPGLYPYTGQPEDYDTLCVVPRLGCCPGELREYLARTYN